MKGFKSLMKFNQLQQIYVNIGLKFELSQIQFMSAQQHVRLNQSQQNINAYKELKELNNTIIKINHQNYKIDQLTQYQQDRSKLQFLQLTRLMLSICQISKFIDSVRTKFSKPQNSMDIMKNKKNYVDMFQMVSNQLEMKTFNLCQICEETLANPIDKFNLNKWIECDKKQKDITNILISTVSMYNKINQIFDSFQKLQRNSKCLKCNMRVWANSLFELYFKEKNPQTNKKIESIQSLTNQLQQESISIFCEKCDKERLDHRSTLKYLNFERQQKKLRSQIQLKRQNTESQSNTLYNFYRQWLQGFIQFGCQKKKNKESSRMKIDFQGSKKQLMRQYSQNSDIIEINQEVSEQNKQQQLNSVVQVQSSSTNFKIIYLDEQIKTTIKKQLENSKKERSNWNKFLSFISCGCYFCKCAKCNCEEYQDES